MKALLLAMTEDQHDNRSWRRSSMVGVFILMTLALNASTREQAALIRKVYNDANDNVLLLFTAVVVLGQMVAAFTVISAETQRGDLPDKEALMIVIVSHVGTLILHDYLLSMGSAHNFLSVSFFQPLLALITLCIVTSVASRPSMWLSTTVISIGCTFMSIRSSTIIGSDRTSLICILSAFVTVLRNIVIRQLVGVENVVVKLRSKKLITGLFISAVLILLMANAFSSSVLLIPSFCALITCLLSASWFYITTQVLKSYSVPCVSLFCVWAMFLEAILLMPSDHRPDFFVLLLSLALIMFGHYLFFNDYVKHLTSDSSSEGLITTYPPKPVHTHEQYTRIEFLLFAALVMGVIFFVFQPKVSDRDLNTLSYVGLDKFLRKVLVIEVKPQSSIVEEQGQVQLP